LAIMIGQTVAFVVRWVFPFLIYKNNNLLRVCDTEALNLYIADLSPLNHEITQTTRLHAPRRRLY